MKSCQQDISKNIWARGLKLGQLIGDDEFITWYSFIFPELLPFENLGILKKSEWNIFSKISWKVFELEAWN